MKLAFTGILLAILAVNAVNLVLNAEARPYELKPRSLFASARDSTSWNVRGSFAIYHFLRANASGVTVRLPRALESHAWFLERTANVHVELVDETQTIDPRVYDRMRFGRQVDRVFWLQTREKRDELRLWLDDGARRYVIASVQGRRHAAWVMLPESIYLQALEMAR